uniref:Uncharacterized protein n=1 Tax=Candidatus Kentrum sp. LFY TaxID=2126342 RepID=A0A450UT94_9GAMM|nr:MAG: hypothetical protein BECKLFY1418B_GA0070995_10748 [Candidatus Kentron sp. LFY]
MQNSDLFTDGISTLAWNGDFDITLLPYSRTTGEKCPRAGRIPRNKSGPGKIIARYCQPDR